MRRAPVPSAPQTVNVWLDDDYGAQHYAPPPSDDTSHQWSGATACGAEGTLRWIPNERIDRAELCPACVAAQGATPPLEGDDPGPV